MLPAGMFTGGKPAIAFTFQFRTQLADGVLFFAFGGARSYFLVQLVASQLQWTISDNGLLQTLTYSDSNVTLCNGQFHTITLTTNGSQMMAAERLQSPMSTGDPTQKNRDLVFTSPLYVGGAPPPNSDGDSFLRANNLGTTISRSNLNILSNIYIYIF